MEGNEQAIIVKFNYGMEGMQPLQELEGKLKAAIENAGMGKYDGHEMAEDNREGYLFLYSSDVDELFRTVEPVFKETAFLNGAKVTLRYGPPGSTAPIGQTIL